MPRFRCPSCKEVIDAEEEARGTVVACAECGKRVKVPSAKPVPAAAKGKAATPPPAPAKRKPPPPTRDDDEAGDDEKKPKRRRDDDEPSEDDARPRKKKKKRRKKGQAAAAGVFGGLGTILVIVAVLFLLSFLGGRGSDNNFLKYVREFLEERGVNPILAFGITAVLGIVPFSFWLLVNTKSSIMAGIPDDMDFKPVDPGKFSDLDEDKLAHYTGTLQALGFQHLMDYTVDTELEMGIEGFARLMVHEDKHVFAEINQAFVGDMSAVPMRCSLSCLLDDDWSVMVTDRSPTKESYMMRRPKAVWKSLPDDEPEQLFEALVKLAKKMRKSLEVDVLTDDTAEAYFKNEKKANRERKQAVQGRWSVGLLLEMWLFDRNPKMEWLGEFKR